MAEFRGFRLSRGFGQINGLLIFGKFSQLLGSGISRLACGRRGG